MRLLYGLFMVMAVGLGLLIAWLGTTSIVDAPAKALDRLQSGTAQQEKVQQENVKQGQPER